MHVPNGIAERLAAVRERIDAAARAAGREPAVGHARRGLEGPSPRRRDPRRARRRVSCDFGENRAQELRRQGDPRWAGDVPAPVWHFVGRLQRNKVRMLAPHVAQWHSVDRSELGRRARARTRPVRACFVQVNVAGEPQKGGCAPGEARGARRPTRAPTASPSTG